MIDLGDWKEPLSPLFSDERYRKIREFLKYEYSHYIVYPDMYDIFNCFRFTPFANVKAVLLGQDPYHEEGQAHGLCFSVKEGVKKPGRSHQVGEGGGAPSQYRAHRARTSGKFARKLRVELVHRQRHLHFERAKDQSCIHFMGRQRAEKEAAHRQKQTSRFGMRAPLAPLGVFRLFRLPPLLKDQRVSRRARHCAHRLGSEPLTCPLCNL